MKMSKKKLYDSFFFLKLKKKSFLKKKNKIWHISIFNIGVV
jgi:hypothetical protein